MRGDSELLERKGDFFRSVGVQEYRSADNTIDSERGTSSVKS